jgi:B-cell receptor-associated protein 31
MLAFKLKPVITSILERTSTLVIQMLKREEELEYAKQEHQSSSKDQGRLINMEQNYKSQIDALEEELKDLQVQERDFATLKKRVQQQSEEYHQLAVEKNLLATEPKKTI